MVFPIRLAAALLVLVAAFALGRKRESIPSWLTWPAIVVGLVVPSLLGGIPEAIWSILAFVVTAFPATVLVKKEWARADLGWLWVAVSTISGVLVAGVSLVSVGLLFAGWKGYSVARDKAQKSYEPAPLHNALVIGLGWLVAVIAVAALRSQGLETPTY